MASKHHHTTKQRIGFTVPVTVEPEIVIKDTTSLNNLGVLLVKDADIQNITKNTGELVDANEYQVHYWYLNGRLTFPDGGIIDIAIPTVYFNYKQTVSSASVDFHLSDVDTMSEAVMPIHNMQVATLVDLLDTTEIETLGASFQWIGVNLGTIHKHPGQLLSFSGTDLSTKADDPGICFPFGEVDLPNKPSFSSIMVHKDNSTYLGHTEYRVASKEDKTITYKEGRCFTYVSKAMTLPSSVEALLGKKPEVNSFEVSKHLLNLTIPIEIVNFVKSFDSIEYSANTDCITEDNVSKEIVVTHSYYSKGYNSPQYNATPNISYIPHANSKEWLGVAKYIEEVYEVKIIPRTKLFQLSPDKLVKHHEVLREIDSSNVSYLPIGPSIPYKVAELQDEIYRSMHEDMLDDILSEKYTPADEKKDEITSMKNDLRAWGVPEKNIDNIPDSTIRIWHGSF